MPHLFQAPITRNDHIVRSWAPGTCGELVQGAIDGQDFLVNCPVDLYSQAIAPLGMQAGLSVHHAELHGKVMQAAQVVSGICGIKLHHELRIDSDNPRGKGRATPARRCARGC